MLGLWIPYFCGVRGRHRRIQTAGLDRVPPIVYRKPGSQTKATSFTSSATHADIAQSAIAAPPVAATTTAFHAPGSHFSAATQALHPSLDALARSATSVEIHAPPHRRRDTVRNPSGKASPPLPSHRHHLPADLSARDLSLVHASTTGQYQPKPSASEPSTTQAHCTPGIDASSGHPFRIPGFRMK